MKNLESKSSKLNIIFSSFLVIGYIICAYFFSTLANQLSGKAGFLVRILILVVFGLLLFYATRVGEGKQVRRFSPWVLVLIDIPALYIILASLIPTFPFSAAINPELAQQVSEASQLAAQGAASTAINVGAPSVILLMACVALGYGLPYTFFSGYEIKEEDEAEQEAAVVAGGIAEELAAEEAADDQAAEKAAEAAADAEEAAEETAEEAAEEAAETQDAAEEAADDTEEKKEEE